MFVLFFLLFYSFPFIAGKENKMSAFIFKLVKKTCLSSLNITKIERKDILNKTKIKCSCKICTLYFIQNKKKTPCINGQ